MKEIGAQPSFELSRPLFTQRTPRSKAVVKRIYREGVA
jgi:hypothetical protein